MKRIANLTLLTLATALLIACSKDDNVVTTQPVQSVTVRDLAADPTSTTAVSTTASSGTAVQPLPATGKYTLYSLRDNKVIANTDSASNKWDIGFRSTSIIINGGAIRSGQGGANVYTGTFDALTAIPTSATFAQDQSATQLAVPGGSGNGWYNYSSSTNLVSAIPGRVLLIRTGDGTKYAKLEILSYYLGAPASPTSTTPSRYFTFRYTYQPNGSMTLN
jgi:hypothetical protein